MAKRKSSFVCIIKTTKNQPGEFNVPFSRVQVVLGYMYVVVVAA